ncbi:hypothetical protein VRU48_12335 [Pedobacter sp. KR3-3]|uniref:Prepilin type IV endopeptidase peptidase domain-containing protein n=1 Tax=Pedobacter albus TaxID=3113905 RepID=A0ABU7I8V0_9SPHI|nr:hypothetical protein [Pedobacter sp. KR3-3]MEE1945900.1 hypothetical protein [Pedobacter sp. KR3-3]
MYILRCAVWIVLLAIAYQDFKFRAVYWWLFVLLMAGLSALMVLESSAGSIGTNLLYNGSFLGVQLLFLTLYFSFKQKKLVNIFADYFGLGDLLFLLSITVYLSFLNYLFFYLFSLLAVILVSIGSRVLSKNSNPKIPLAGEQAILLLVFMVVDLLSSSIDLTNDWWLTAYLM